ncbi:DHA2 family efflux MFS transporter permease subunit [Paenibacillus wulumuqiensis]|uniref:DHA2 family efflux MFS transporter permease subunit n=1 Tax=Paenibacillus wulumuqiensis TaxID=1567107 RepID=UPI0006192438|nr:DHA2 family efflux MFS transporter permease subunit [Paenibacillus wulumuqiensis]
MAHVKSIQPAAFARPGWIVSSLIAANFLAQLMQTMLNTALPRMMSDLGILENQAQWLVTLYLLTSGIVVPAAGYLLGRFSTRALFFASAGAFLAGLLIAAVSSGYFLLLIGRLVQGIGAGLLMPLFQTTILRVFPREKIGAAMGTVGIVMGLAPALGPVLSGIVVEDHSWRMLFYAMLPVAVLNLALSFVSLKNVGERSPAKLDLRSLLYSSAGFSGVLYGLNSVGRQGNTLSAWAVLLVGIVLVALFVMRQLRLPEPFLNMRLFRNRIFTQTTLISIALFFSMIGVEIFLPLYAQNVRGMTPRESGLTLLPGALLMGISGFISGRLYDRFGAARLVRFALLSMTAALLLFALLIGPATPILLLVLLFAVFMVSVGFIMSPVTAYAMANIPPSLIKHASPMMIMVRAFSGALSGVVLAAVLTPFAAHSSLPFPANTLPGIRAVFWILTIVTGAGAAYSFFMSSSRTSVEETSRDRALLSNLQEEEAERRID